MIETARFLILDHLFWTVPFEVCISTGSPSRVPVGDIAVPFGVIALQTGRALDSAPPRSARLGSVRSGPASSNYFCRTALPPFSHQNDDVLLATNFCLFSPRRQRHGGGTAARRRVARQSNGLDAGERRGDYVKIFRWRSAQCGAVPGQRASRWASHPAPPGPADALPLSEAFPEGARGFLPIADYSSTPRDARALPGPALTERQYPQWAVTGAVRSVSAPRHATGTPWQRLPSAPKSGLGTEGKKKSEPRRRRKCNPRKV